MRKSFIVLFLVCTACCMQSVAEARSGLVLAEDYPYANIFLQMVRRGLAEYSAKYHYFPTNLQTLVNEGYTAYELPAQAQLNYFASADEARFDTGGRASYASGSVCDFNEFVVKLPSTDLYTVEQWPVPVNGDDSQREWQDLKSYNFPGAQWLDQGASGSEVEFALPVERVATHLIWASTDYIADMGAPPADLAALEAYVGVPRNPAAWRNITLVDSAQAVNQAGAVFAGWDNGEWVVVANLGFKQLEERYVQREGQWVKTMTDIVAY